MEGEVLHLGQKKAQPLQVAVKLDSPHGAQLRAQVNNLLGRLVAPSCQDGASRGGRRRRRHMTEVRCTRLRNSQDQSAEADWMRLARIRLGGALIRGPALGSAPIT